MTKLLIAFLFFATVCLGGCSGNAALRESQSLTKEGRFEEGIEVLRQALDETPTNPELRAAYLRSRDKAVATLISQAEQALAGGQSENAERLYQRILAIDPGNARASAGSEQIAREERHKTWMEQAVAAWAKGDADTALARLRGILSENPRHTTAVKLRQTIEEKLVSPPVEAKLSAALRKPITIEFKDAPLKQVFEVISRNSGLNFVFDKDIRAEQKATIFLRNSTTQDAVNLLLLTNQLEQRVLDASSILIYPNTPAKARDYQPLTVKTFFLNNADVKNAANTLKTIVKTKDIVVDERQNMIIIRDTPDAVRLAEKLLAMHDLPEPEVMMEVEILEVTRTRLAELGIRWPDQLTLSPLAGTSGGSVTLADLKNLSASRIGSTTTPMTFTAKQLDGNIKILANPRIRTRSRESAKILIGDKVPNITTTSTATGFVSDSVQYIDVGLKLEATPTVFLDNEVSIKLAMEVSNIVNQVQTKSGSLAYQLGTRTASTVLRLKDGENQVLAGLINDEDRVTGNRVPGLGDLPVLGRLFGSQSDNRAKTEIVLSITPRLVRNIKRPTLAESEFDSGTEANVRSRSIEATAVSTTSAPTLSPHMTGSQPDQAVVPGNFEGAPASAPLENKAPSASAPASTAGVTSAGTTTIHPVGPTALAWQGPSQAKVGETFTVSLEVQPGEPLIGVPYSIGYDPKVLDPITVTSGSLLKQGGAATNFSYRVDRNSGQILATETRTGWEGTAAPGTLVNVTFKTLVAAPRATIQVLALAPLGRGGRSVATAMPSPQVLAIIP